MKIRNILIPSLLLFPFVLVHAESVKFTRSQASELYVALATAEAGFLPANTVAAADDLNTLRPHVEALDKGKQAYQRAVRALVKTQPADAEEQAQKFADQLEAKGDELITIDLTSLALSDEELTAAKVKPAILATIRRWLLPKKK